MLFIKNISKIVSARKTSTRFHVLIPHLILQTPSHLLFPILFTQVTCKLEQWAVEQSAAGVLEGPTVTKAQWYEFTFRQLLNMEEAQVRKQREKEEKARLAAEAAAAEEEDDE